MKTQTRRFSIVAVSVALLALQGCGTSSVSKGITDDGKATDVVFPSIGSDVGLPGGTFPNLNNLRAVGPGVTKDQLYDLLGRPHFREGLTGPREWDYIFNFRGAAGAVTTCQYKVIFDREYKGQSFYWQPANCSEMLEARPRAVAVVERPAPPPAPAPRRTTLGADGMFRFDGGTAADLLPEGRRRIEALAGEIKRNFRALREIRVTGHTDRLGADAYNDALSLARANTVRDLLVQQGIDARAIHTEGLGKRHPLVNCPGTHASAELVSCLQPNRRVEIDVTGEE